MNIIHSPSVEVAVVQSNGCTDVMCKLLPILICVRYPQVKQPQLNFWLRTRVLVIFALGLLGNRAGSAAHDSRNFLHDGVSKPHAPTPT